MIVFDRDIVKLGGIHGTPGLIAEVLTPRTAKNDTDHKKRLDEKSGVERMLDR